MAKNSNGITQQFNDLITGSSTTALYPVGTLRYETDDTNGLKVYKYVKAGGAIANGNVLSAHGTAGIAVWNSTTASVDGKVPACGIGIGTIASGSYGWMLVEGYHSAVKKFTTSSTAALRVCYHLCGKIKQALNGATATAMLFIDNIVALSAKVSACTSVPCVVRLM